MIESLILIILVAAFIYDAEPLLDRWFNKMVIVSCDRQPYLHRWYVFKSKTVTLFVHKFVNSDEDRALHDHPWAFLVIPIWRGYIEHSDRRTKISEKWERLEEWVENDRSGSKTLNEVVWGRIPVVNRVLPFVGTRYRDFYYRHRVELLKDEAGAPLPAWSIFFHFTRRRTWGYWLPTGFMQHDKWWSALCE